LEIRLAVTTQVAISQVVGKDEDEIWGGRLCAGHLRKKAGEAKEGKMQPTERERLETEKLQTGKKERRGFHARMIGYLFQKVGIF
jgi:hypothetical protein